MTVEELRSRLLVAMGYATGALVRTTVNFRKAGEVAREDFQMSCELRELAPLVGLALTLLGEQRECVTLDTAPSAAEEAKP